MIPVFYYHYFQFVLTKYVFVWFYQEKKRDEMICKKKLLFLLSKEAEWKIFIQFYLTNNQV